MAKRIIECTVNDEYIIGGGVPVGAAGSHDDVVLRLAFGEMWAGLNIYATFTDALGQNPTVVLLVPSMLVDGEAMTYDVTIPASAKKIEGKMVVSLTGYVVIDGTEGSATNTTTTSFRVLPSKVALADDGTIDATLAQQLHDEINQAKERVDDLELVAIAATERATEAAEEAEEAAASAAAAEEAAAGVEAEVREIHERLDTGDLKGEPGESPTIELTETDSGVTIKVTDPNGSIQEAHIMSGGATASAALEAAAEAKEIAESKAPAYTYGTADLTAGSSALETGKLHFVYE